MTRILAAGGRDDTAPGPKIYASEALGSAERAESPEGVPVHHFAPGNAVTGLYERGQILKRRPDPSASTCRPREVESHVAPA